MNKVEKYIKDNNIQGYLSSVLDTDKIEKYIKNDKKEMELFEQERYFNENLDLRYYKDDSTVGLTNDKYLNAKHAEEISRRTGKPFTDRYKVY